MPPKKVRIESNKVAAPRGGPPCTVHPEQTMAFDAETLVWRCTVQNCNQVAYPRNEISRSKPQVFVGTLEVVLVEDGNKCFLRLKEHNLMFDIGDYLKFPIETQADIKTGVIDPFEVILALKEATFVKENDPKEHRVVAKKRLKKKP